MYGKRAYVAIVAALLFLAMAKPASAQGTLSLTVDKQNITKGQCTTLRWSVPSGWSNWSTTNFSAAPGKTGQTFQGSQQVCPQATVTYQIEVAFSGTLAGNFQMRTAKVNVSAPQPQPQPKPPQPPMQQEQPLPPQQIQPSQPQSSEQPPDNPIVVEADQWVIYDGDCTNIKWHIPPYYTVLFDDQEVNADGWKFVCPGETTTYLITARDKKWLYGMYATIVVLPREPEGVLQVDRTTINAGECTTIRWQLINVDSLTLNGAQVGNPGIFSICPKVTTTYTLSVTSSVGPRSRSVTVNVIQSPTQQQAQTQPKITFKSEELLLKNLGDTGHMDAADYEMMFGILATLPEAKKCISLFGLQVTPDTPAEAMIQIYDQMRMPGTNSFLSQWGLEGFDLSDNAEKCYAGLKQLGAIADKYKTHDWPKSRIPNYDSYCATQYDGNPYPPNPPEMFWMCKTQADIKVIRPDEICRLQYPGYPLAAILDEKDPNTWRCVRGNYYSEKNK